MMEINVGIVNETWKKIFNFKKAVTNITFSK